MTQQEHIIMGNKASLMLQDEEIQAIQEETGCEYDVVVGLTLISLILHGLCIMNSLSESN